MRDLDLGDERKWMMIRVGPDPIYVNEGVPLARVGLASGFLRDARQVLRAAVGVEPPRCGLALLADDYPNVRIYKREGIHIHPILASEPAGEAFSSVVHEWTHDILNTEFEFPSDDDARYLEDGLCDYFAAFVSYGARFQGQVLTRRAKGLREAKRSDGRRFSRPKRVNLLTLAREFDQYMSADPSDPSDVRDICAADQGFGYDLGLAYWVERGQFKPDFLARLREALAADRPWDGGDLARVVDRLAPGTLSVEDMDVRRARAILERFAKAQGESPP